LNSGTGWPSFDQESGNNIKTNKDLGNMRTEVLCNICDAHLGHVFLGEGFIELNTISCINSVALEFIPFENISNTEEVSLSAGCFWGVEPHFGKLDGFLNTEVGLVHLVRLLHLPHPLHLLHLILRLVRCTFCAVHCAREVNGQPRETAEKGGTGWWRTCHGHQRASTRSPAPCPATKTRRTAPSPQGT